MFVLTVERLEKALKEITERKKEDIEEIVTQVLMKSYFKEDFEGHIQLAEVDTFITSKSAELANNLKELYERYYIVIA